MSCLCCLTVLSCLVVSCLALPCGQRNDVRVWLWLWLALRLLLYQKEGRTDMLNEGC